MYIDEDERQLHHDRQAEGLALEGHARPRRSGHAHRPAIGRADGRPDGRDLVLGLEGLDPEVLVARQLVQDVRGRRDRVGAVKQRSLGQLRGSHEAEGRGLVAGDVAVLAGLEAGGRDDVALVEDLGRLAEVVAGLESPLVALGDDRPLGELLVDPDEGRVHRALVEPEHEAQGEEVLGQVDLLVGELEALGGTSVERRDRDREDAVGRQRAVRQGVARVADLVEVDGREGVLVDDEGAARREVAEVRLEGRRVHGHEDVGLVAGRVDLGRREAQLEAGDAGQGAGRGADLGREVRVGADVVAEDRRGAGELRPGELHPVAGVAGEADRDALELALLRGPPGTGGSSTVTRPPTRASAGGVAVAGSGAPRGRPRRGT